MPRQTTLTPARRRAPQQLDLFAGASRRKLHRLAMIWPSYSLISDSNRVSANPSLRFRETGFCRQRQRRAARRPRFMVLELEDVFRLQTESPPPGNAIFRGRDKGPRKAPGNPIDRLRRQNARTN